MTSRGRVLSSAWSGTPTPVPLTSGSGSSGGPLVRIAFGWCRRLRGSAHGRRPVGRVRIHAGRNRQHDQRLPLERRRRDRRAGRGSGRKRRRLPQHGSRRFGLRSGERAAVSATPWLTAAKTLSPQVGHSLPTSQFFEGGVNLTDSDLGGACFNTFIADTRSSASLEATLFRLLAWPARRLRDGAGPRRRSTTPALRSPPGGGGRDIPSRIRPTPTILMSGPGGARQSTGADTFTATLTFHLCGPFPARVDRTVCGTGGVFVLRSIHAREPSTTDGDVHVRRRRRSDVGRDGIAGEPTSLRRQKMPACHPRVTARATECFIVNPRQPALTTQAGASPVILGQPVTDTATLTNTGSWIPAPSGPAGSTERVDQPGHAGRRTRTARSRSRSTGGQSVHGPGDRHRYEPADRPRERRRPPRAGQLHTGRNPATYHWVASYSGDLPNTLASGSVRVAWTRTRTSWSSAGPLLHDGAGLAARTTRPRSPETRT